MTRSPLIRLAWALRPYRMALVVGTASSISNKVLDLMPPILVAWVIDTVQGTPPHWIQRIIPNEGPLGTAVFLSILGIAVFFFESLTQWVYQRTFQRMAQWVQHDLRCHLYQHIQTLDVAYFENSRLGHLLTMIYDDVNELDDFLTNLFNEIIQLVVLVIFALIVMSYTCWQLALFSLVPIPLIIAGSLLYQRFISPYYRAIRLAVGDLMARFETNLSGIRVIKSFTSEAFELARVKQASSDYKQARLNTITWSTVYIPTIRMVIAMGFSGVLLLGSYWILSGSPILSIGELVLFSMMIQRLLWPLTRLGAVFDDYSRASVSALRICDLLNKSPQIMNSPNAIPLKKTAPRIEFKKVYFEYTPNTPILNDLTFSVSPGQTIGLAGFTGSGKSTIMKCLLRFYDVQKGIIEINGRPITDFDITSLRQSISLVSQDIYLFHGTIRDNIAYGTQATNEAIAHAASMAKLNDVIDASPQGYDSVIGENGITLSGGQRQRLSIARALLKNAPIMLFDEATSAVDTDTEAAIQANLNQLTHGKTTLIIAHRLSTLRDADILLVLHHGQIIEQGSHADLIQQNGHYANLWHRQTTTN
jgi:ATP-binding cassette subfamily B protein